MKATLKTEWAENNRLKIDLQADNGTVAHTVHMTHVDTDVLCKLKLRKPHLEWMLVSVIKSCLQSKAALELNAPNRTEELAASVKHFDLELKLLLPAGDASRWDFMFLAKASRYESIFLYEGDGDIRFSEQGVPRLRRASSSVCPLLRLPLNSLFGNVDGEKNEMAELLAQTARDFAALANSQTPSAEDAADQFAALLWYLGDSRPSGLALGAVFNDIGASLKTLSDLSADVTKKTLDGLFNEAEAAHLACNLVHSAKTGRVLVKV